MGHDSLHDLQRHPENGGEELLRVWGEGPAGGGWALPTKTFRYPDQHRLSRLCLADRRLAVLFRSHASVHRLFDGIDRAAIREAGLGSVHRREVLTRLPTISGRFVHNWVDGQNAQAG